MLQYSEELEISLMNKRVRLQNIGVVYIINGTRLIMRKTILSLIVLVALLLALSLSASSISSDQKLKMQADNSEFSGKQACEISYDNDFDSQNQSKISNFLEIIFNDYIFGLVFLSFIISSSVLHYFFGRKLHANNYINNYKITKDEMDSVGYIRDIPFDGDILASFNVLKNLNMIQYPGDLVSAFILRWVHEDKIRFKNYVSDDGTYETWVTLSSPLESFTGCEKSLYKMLLSAAKSDRVLQPKEFNAWIKKNPQYIHDWISEADFDGSIMLESKGYTHIVYQLNIFGQIKSSKMEFTDIGMVYALKLIGFKKFLDDFTIINEREPIEVKLWDDYLVFATLIGLAENVSSSMQSICPQYFVLPETISKNGFYDICDNYPIIQSIVSFGNSLRSFFYI